MKLTATLITSAQTFRTALAGVTFSNADGTSRQELVRRLRSSETLRLVREPDNTYDRFAVAVFNSSGAQLGYLPAGDTRLASHIDGGGPASAAVVAVTGGGGILGRLFKAFEKTYGCVVEITKTDPDWSAVRPYMDSSAQIEKSLQAAETLEESDRTSAIATYRQAIADIAALDAKGQIAASWRRARYPVNRLSMMLERNKDYRAALAVIEEYERYRDALGISAADSRSVASRKTRLQSKVAKGSSDANPSIEGTLYGLRPPSAPHVKR